MSENSRLEALSALVDDELADARRTRALDALGADQALRQRWARYHLISAAMRAEGLAPPGLAAQVARQIEAEPVPLPGRGIRGPVRPLTGVAIAASVAAIAVVALRLMLGADPAGPVGTGSTVASSSAPLASASAPRTGDASVVGIAAGQGLGVGQMAATSKLPAVIKPVLVPARRVSEPDTAGRAELRIVADGEPGTVRIDRGDLRPGVEVRLNHYLVNHTESMRTGMRGMFPYAALVGYEPVK